MIGVFLRKFTEKINISVSINSDGIVTVKKDDENYSYNNFIMNVNTTLNIFKISIIYILKIR